MAISLLIVLGVACGNDDSMTSATEPTQFIPPTEAPGSEDFSPRVNDLLDLGRLKSFPNSLSRDAEPLSKESGRQIWTAFIEETRIIAGVGTLVQFCENGSGTWLSSERSEQQVFEGEEFSWEVKHGLGDRWNIPRMEMVFTKVDLTGNPGWPDRISFLMTPPEDDGVLKWTAFGAFLVGPKSFIENTLVYETDGCSPVEQD